MRLLFGRERLWSRLPIPARLIVGLALLTALGTLVLLTPLATYPNRPLTLEEAAFTATSALSVTGLTLISAGRDLNPFGQVVLMVLIQLGGVGFMVVAVVILRLVGRQVMLEDRMALRDSLGLLSVAEIVQLTRRALIAVFIMEGIGTLALWLHWRARLADFSELQVLLYAAFHAISAFCNAGFDLFSGLPQFPDGVPNDGVTLFILAVMILLGGLGIPVIGDLLTWPQLHKLSLHTRITLVLTVLLGFGGGALIFLSETLGRGAIGDQPPAARFGLSLFQAISARTAGYVGFGDFGALSSGAQIALMALMFVGAAPASMGGGITTGTFAIMVLAMWSYLRRLPETQVAGRTISHDTLRRASAVFIVSLLLLTTATYTLVVFHPNAPLNQVVFEVISAFATCGLSLGLTGELTPFGHVVLMVIMFWGRLGPLTIVSALATPRRHRHLSYPEGQILIG
ncbi:MAG: potassium transporter TrkG [Anaerolineae bacterium]|nr:hypothetical protein [Thermoflexales bacterium]MDW8396039.1 potassium transporter TrkG [Anaerolineae bacterium]